MITKKLQSKSAIKRIAIHTTELDMDRIDGTRVYLKEVLDRLGKIAPDKQFFLYHKDEFNKALTPPRYDNYFPKKLSPAPFWTQTIFAKELWGNEPDVVWLPLHNLPIIRKKKMKFVVTIHDLAFKIFPETFPKKDLYKLNYLTDWAVKKSDKIITVSEATKKDLLKFYPKLGSHKIEVIHLGVNIAEWQDNFSDKEVTTVLKKFRLVNQKYLISVGAIQPRKNLIFLIKIFEKIKKNYPELKLVLAGGNGWLWEKIHQRAQESKFSSDIIFTGKASFQEIKILMKKAHLFVFPTRYEGFGIAGLEAMASGLPIVAANNSSLPEVLGSAAEYFNDNNEQDCVDKVLKVLENKKKRRLMQEKSLIRAQKFSWDKCAQKTMEILSDF